MIKFSITKKRDSKIPTRLRVDFTNYTPELINSISELMIKTQDKISNELPKIYSKDLVETLFMHPYTKIEFLVDRLKITRKTTSKYLSELENNGILKNIQIKNSKYFINVDLFDLLRKGA